MRRAYATKGTIKTPIILAVLPEIREVSFSAEVVFPEQVQEMKRDRDTLFKFLLFSFHDDREFNIPPALTCWFLLAQS